MGTSVKRLVEEARAGIGNLSPAELAALLDDPRTTLVDLREAEELDDQGLIAGAFHVPRGVLEFCADPASPTYRPELDPDRHTVLYCAAGSRSALAARTLQELGFGEVSHLDGGIAAWKQAGLPVDGLRSWEPSTVDLSEHHR